jgi:transitional endoplasmic reticulum ATPase
MSDLLERTLQGLRAALVVTPDNGPLRLQVAELLRALGRDSEALEQARAALPHLPPGEARDAASALVDALAPPARSIPDNLTPLGGRGGLQMLRGGSSADDALPLEQERVRVDFSDIGGLDPVKEEIRMKIILPFQRPEIFARYGKRRGGGLLLYGPPGCGKTLLARATAGEAGATFLNVAIDQVLDMWFGGSEQKLSALFEEARRRAPAVLFFDEVEAIGASRQQLRHTAGRTLVNQLLSEMDGVDGSNDRVLVMAATNAPWNVDAALMRPGRFDRVVFVPPPDAEARAEILRLHLRERPQGQPIDTRKVVQQTDGFSGADLAELVERAVDGPLREALLSGTMRDVTTADLLRAHAEARSTTAAWFETAKNYATFANVGGVYDELVKYIEARKAPKGRFW